MMNLKNIFKSKSETKVQLFNCTIFINGNAVSVFKVSDYIYKDGYTLLDKDKKAICLIKGANVNLILTPSEVYEIK